MKKLLIFSIFIISSQYTFSQHYGGLYVSPHWSTSGVYSGFWQNLGENFKNYDYSFGYSFGYQGLLMADKRFSFAYGINYSFESIEENYKSPKDIGFASGGIYNNIIIRRESIHAIEIPATWRYNITKGKKLQPYISLSTTFKFPIQSNMEFIDNNNEKYSMDSNSRHPFSTYFDFGIGVNYKINDYMFNIQPTIRPWNSFGRLGVGFSVMKKF